MPSRLDIMFVKSKHTRSVSLKTLLRAVFYIYIYPKNGYLKKLRERFGSTARLLLNTELALTVIIKNLPGREPGKIIGVEARNHRRFAKLIEKQGLKAVAYEGDTELLELTTQPNVLAIVIPDSYGAMTSRRKNKLESSTIIKIIYQNKKRPKSTALLHDIYIWEPKDLPRSVCGAVVVVVDDRLDKIRQAIMIVNQSRSRFSANAFINEIYRATRGFENKYRRIDKAPPRVLARMLYDFYK